MENQSGSPEAATSTPWITGEIRYFYQEKPSYWMKKLGREKIQELKEKAEARRESYNKDVEKAEADKTIEFYEKILKVLERRKSGKEADYSSANHSDEEARGEEEPDADLFGEGSEEG